MMKRAVVLGVTMCMALAVASPSSAGTRLGAPARLVATDRAVVPGAWILVDDDTGNVVQANNDRTPLPPASITKLLTGLVASAHLGPDSVITVTADVNAVPALKIGMVPGQIWTFNDVIHALLLVSANDAAIALADATSGSVPAFAEARRQAAQELGLADAPVLNDPAGLDDSESYAGGDRISARDMAIVARAALASPVMRPIMAEQRYDFVETDASKHYMLNHNTFLKAYPGAIGMKTGYTLRAHHTLVAAATRNGRTMIAVVLDADNPEVKAAQLMDAGFATPAVAEPVDDHLTRSALHPQFPSGLAHSALPVVRQPKSHTTITGWMVTTITLAVAGFGLLIRKPQVQYRRFRDQVRGLWRRRTVAAVAELAATPTAQPPTTSAM